MPRLAAPAAVYAVILGFSSLPGGTVPTVPVAASYAAHLTLYAALGGALRWAVDRLRLATTATAAAVLLLGAADEWYQTTVPGRTADARDLAVDVAAGTVAALATRALLAKEELP